MVREPEQEPAFVIYRYGFFIQTSGKCGAIARIICAKKDLELWIINNTFSAPIIGFFFHGSSDE